MSDLGDFDERLSAVLTAEAEDAPPASGLAQAARRRHVVRRRRRVAAGGVAAALAIAAPVVLLVGGGEGDDNLVGADTTEPVAEWQTIAEDDVRAEVPGDWRKFACDFDGFEKEVFGPDRSAACGFETYVAFYGSATFDPIERPGVISDEGSGSSGYVYAGGYAVSVSTSDRDLTRRILTSARIDGQPEIDGSAWTTLDGLDLQVEVPVDWGLGPDARLDDFAVCAAPGDRDDPPKTAGKPGSRPTWIELDYRGGRWISVSAPTQAVAELVLASVETMPGSNVLGCLSDDGVRSVG